MIVYRFTFVLSVSIHTLAWRVTAMKSVCLIGINVSIHTLAWRVT